MSNKMSPIERMFNDACKAIDIVFEREEQVSRYRVDCIDESRKLIVELDGHETHKSKEDRTYDAKRDRHLQREGYTLIRFTGSEIYRDAAACAQEVLQTIKLMEPSIKADGAIYIDWQFFCRRVSKKYAQYKSEGITVHYSSITTSRLLEFISNYLNLSGKYDVHLFGLPSSFSDSLVSIDTLKVVEFDNVTIHVFENQCEWLIIELSEHLHFKGTIYKKLHLVADDPMLQIELNRGRHLDCLISLDDTETNLSQIESDNWQDIDIIIGHLFGLEPHDMI
ncbi:endonuclease domain-containing protein [Vibrio lentus]|nr:DUF559 domain-containing protein [Vibrio lentus]